MSRRDDFARFGVSADESKREQRKRLEGMGLDEAEIDKIVGVSTSTSAPATGGLPTGVPSAVAAPHSGSNGSAHPAAFGDEDDTDDMESFQQARRARIEARRARQKPPEEGRAVAEDGTVVVIDDGDDQVATLGLDDAPAAVAASANGTVGRALASGGDDRGASTLLGDFAAAVAANPHVASDGLSAHANGGSASRNRRRYVLASLRAVLPRRSHSASTAAESSSAAASSSHSAQAVFDGLVAYDPAATGDAVDDAKRFAGGVVSFLQAEVEAPLLARCQDSDFQAFVPPGAVLPADVVVLSDLEDPAPNKKVQFPHNLEHLQDPSLLAAMTTFQFYPSIAQLFLQAKDTSKLDAAEPNIQEFFTTVFGHLIASPQTPANLRILVQNLRTVIQGAFKIFRFVNEDSPTLSEGEDSDVAYLVALVEGLTRLSTRDISVEAFPVIDTILQDIFSIKHENLRKAIGEKLVGIATNVAESEEARLTAVMALSYDEIAKTLEREQRAQLFKIKILSATTPQIFADLRALNDDDKPAQRALLQKLLLLKIAGPKRIEFLLPINDRALSPDEMAVIAGWLLYSEMQPEDIEKFDCFSHAVFPTGKEVFISQINYFEGVLKFLHGFKQLVSKTNHVEEPRTLTTLREYLNSDLLDQVLAGQGTGSVSAQSTGSSWLADIPDELKLNASDMANEVVKIAYKALQDKLPVSGEIPDANRPFIHEALKVLLEKHADTHLQQEEKIVVRDTLKRVLAGFLQRYMTKDAQFLKSFPMPKAGYAYADNMFHEFKVLSKIIQMLDSRDEYRAASRGEFQELKAQFFRGHEHLQFARVIYSALSGKADGARARISEFVRVGDPAAFFARIAKKFSVPVSGDSQELVSVEDLQYCMIYVDPGVVKNIIQHRDADDSVRKMHQAIVEKIAAVAYTMATHMGSLDDKPAVSMQKRMLAFRILMQGLAFKCLGEGQQGNLLAQFDSHVGVVFSDTVYKGMLGQLQMKISRRVADEIEGADFAGLLQRYEKQLARLQEALSLYADARELFASADVARLPAGVRFEVGRIMGDSASETDINMKRVVPHLQAKINLMRTLFSLYERVIGPLLGYTSELISSLGDHGKQGKQGKQGKHAAAIRLHLQRLQCGPEFIKDHFALFIELKEGHISERAFIEAVLNPVVQPVSVVPLCQTGYGSDDEVAAPSTAAAVEQPKGLGELIEAGDAMVGKGVIAGVLSSGKTAKSATPFNRWVDETYSAPASSSDAAHAGAGAAGEPLQAAAAGGWKPAIWEAPFHIAAQFQPLDAAVQTEVVADGDPADCADGSGRVNNASNAS